MSHAQPTSSIGEPREDGQTLAEYALVLSLIAVLAIVALMFVGGSINSILSSIGDAL